MPRIETKDGIIINVPEGVDPVGQDVRNFVTSIRNTSGPGQYDFGTPVNVQEPSIQGVTQQPEIPLTQGALRAAQPGRFKPQPGEGPQTDLLGLLGAATRGAAPVAAGTAIGAALGAPFAGVGAVPGAIAGAGITGLVIPAVDTAVSTINSMFGTKYTTATDAFNDLLTRIGVPEPDTEAERIVQSISQGAAAGGAGAAGGQALAQFGRGAVTKGVGKALAAGVPQQILGGAGAGAGQSIAQEAGAGPAVQIGAGLGGSVLGSALGGIRTAPSAGVTAPIEEAAEAGVRVMTSDVRPPQNFMSRWMQQLQEKIPVFGTGKVRQMQQGERVAAVRNLMEEFGADDVVNVADDIMDDLAITHSANLEKFGKQKMNVIRELSEPSTPVPVTNALDTIDGELSRLRSLNNPEVQPIIDRMEGWKGSIQNQDLENIESLRSIVGESYRGLDEGIRSTGQKSLNKVYTSLRRDMAEYIEATGGKDAISDWEGAMSALHGMSTDMKSSAFKTALNRGDVTPETVNRLLFSQKPSDVRRLFNNLSADGKATARTAILAKIAKNPSNFLPGTEDISPDKFLSAIKKLGTQTGVFFGPDEMKQLEGLTRVLDVTKRAGQAAATPPTGVTLLPVAITGGLAQIFGNGIEGALGTLAAGAGIGGAARIYESAPIRNILMELPTVVKGTPEEAALFKRLLETAQTIQNREEGER
jgi:hypothetical protein